MGVDEHVAVRCPCCDAVDVDTHHVRIYLSQSRGAGKSASTACRRDVPCVEAVRISAPSGERRTVYRKPNLRMGIVVRRGSLPDAPNRGYMGESILLHATHADPKAKIDLRGGSANHDGPAAYTSETHKRQNYARPGHVSFDERSHKLAT